MGNEKVNKYFYSVVFFLLYFALSFSSHARSEDFDKVCSYFQELEKLVNVNTMTHLQHNDYILGKLNNIPPASNARVAWEAIASAIRDLTSLEQAQMEAMGMRGRQYVLAHHDYRILAERFFQAISG